MMVPDRGCLRADWEKMEKALHTVHLETPVMTKQITAWIEPVTVTQEGERASGNERQRGRHPGRRQPRLVAEAASANKSKADLR